MINSSLFSSASMEWETPQEFFDRLDAEFHFSVRHGGKCKVRTVLYAGR